MAGGDSPGASPGDRFESLHTAGFAWTPGPRSVDLDSSRDELHVLATFGLTAVTGATPSQVAVEALILPCRKPSPQRFAGRVDASTPLRWGAPDLATPVRAVAKSEADAVPGAGNHGVSRKNFRTSCPLTRGRA